MSISPRNGPKGFQRLPCLKYYNEQKPGKQIYLRAGKIDLLKGFQKYVLYEKKLQVKVAEH